MENEGSLLGEFCSDYIWLYKRTYRNSEGLGSLEIRP